MAKILDTFFLGEMRVAYILGNKTKGSQAGETADWYNPKLDLLQFSNCFFVFLCCFMW
jgi:hypothetical protein